MKLPGWLTNNPWLVVVIAVVAIGICVVRVASLQNTPQLAQVWFYDIGSGELFAAASEAIPPIDAPSGAPGVRAMVVSCGSCSDMDQRQVMYLEKWADEDHAYLTSVREPGEGTEPTPLLALPEAEPAWVVAETSEGRAIKTKVDQFYRQCPKTFVRCEP